MKKVFALITLAVVLAMTLVPVSAFANSAQREFEGVTSSGAVVKTDCPVAVKKENLTFNINTYPQLFSLDLQSYDANVCAEYEFYNPSDMDVTMQLVFPFGTVPYYLKYDDTDFDDKDKYSAYVDGVAVDTQVRATYTQNAYEFDIDTELPKIRDSRVPLNNFPDDTPVYKYSVECNFSADMSQEERDECYLYAQFNLGENATLFISDNGSFSQVDANGRKLRLYSNDGGFSIGKVDVYSLGEPLTDEYFFNSVQYYREKRSYYGTSTQTTALSGCSLKHSFVERLTVEDLILSNYSSSSGVLRNDYYNAVTYLLNDRGIKGEVMYTSWFDVSDSLMLWYQYDVHIAAKGTVLNKVVAPLYPTVNDYYKPTMFFYDYLLSPASKWASFANLTVTVNTGYFMHKCSLDGFEKTETGYVAHFDRLPNEELRFGLCESEDPDYDDGSSIFVLILVIILLVGGGIILFPIICAIAIPLIVRSVRKKKAAKQAVDDTLILTREEQQDVFDDYVKTDSNDTNGKQ